ncbi:MAG: MBL fold metallo-hydrolase [Flavobacteriales bacterium]|jgi:phosphoribosyl 1,2-cyclic phosphate phosphodiesterase|nr:MBL fold metallo-hydrolase [Flavobacteriales bacterium]
MRVEMTFLGTGTSQGVPVITCSCPVCTSANPRDQRLRSAVLMKTAGQSVVIDSGPDFRQQMLREGVNHLDALVLTHEHKDHIAGMDDIRAFNFRSKKDVPVYASERVQEALKREFHYVFSENTYPGTPKVALHTIEEDPFQIGDDLWWPLPVKHHKLPVLGFRLGDVAYITDANSIEPLAFERLKGLDILVLNALRRESHLSHFTLDEAISLAHRIGARKTYFTHISHQLGCHAEVQEELPHGIELAYDGLRVVSELISD